MGAYEIRDPNIDPQIVGFPYDKDPKKGPPNIGHPHT